MTDHDQTGSTYAPQPSVWMRGLFMVIFAVFFNVAQTVLGVIAVVQFFWMLFAKEKNRALAEFGQSLGRWLARVAEFQSGASDEKPFPWDRWE
jgi:uncharacterized membrane protein